MNIVRRKKYYVEKIWHILSKYKTSDMKKHLLQQNELIMYECFDGNMSKFLNIFYIENINEINLSTDKIDLAFDFLTLEDIAIIKKLCISPSVHYQLYLYVLNQLLELDNNNFLRSFNKLFLDNK